MSTNQSPRHKHEDNDLMIEPIHQKLFSFENQTYHNISKLRNFRYQRAKEWKPVLQNKKLNEDPKLILSMERKKARIINSIRGSVIHDSPPHGSGMMVGKKITSNRSMRRSFNQIKPTVSYQIQSKGNDDYFSSYLDSKKSKNPHMNFSLLYLQEKKKKNKNNSMNMNKQNNSRPQTSRTGSRPQTCREKGSQGIYVDRMITKTVNNKKKELASRSQSANTRNHQFSYFV